MALAASAGEVCKEICSFCWKALAGSPASGLGAGRGERPGQQFVQMRLRMPGPRAGRGRAGWGGRGRW